MAADRRAPDHNVLNWHAEKCLTTAPTSQLHQTLARIPIRQEKTRPGRDNRATRVLSRSRTACKCTGESRDFQCKVRSVALQDSGQPEACLVARSATRHADSGDIASWDRTVTERTASPSRSGRLCEITGRAEAENRTDELDEWLRSGLGAARDTPTAPGRRACSYPAPHNRLRSRGTLSGTSPEAPSESPDSRLACRPRR